MGVETYVAVAATFATILLSILQWKSSAKVQNADAIDKIGNAYDGLLDKFAERVTHLETRVEFLEAELKRYSNWSSRLVKQLVENDIQPVPIDTAPKAVKA
jgi:hypothetical protein